MSTKEYRDQNDEERMQSFRDVVAEEKQRHKHDVTPRSLRNSLVIAVRHFVHPFAYHLALGFMQCAADACGDTLDMDGFWPPCRGELWEEDVLFREASIKKLREMRWKMRPDGRWLSPMTGRIYSLDMAVMSAFTGPRSPRLLVSEVEHKPNNMEGIVDLDAGSIADSLDRREGRGQYAQLSSVPKPDPYESRAACPPSNYVNDPQFREE